MSLQEDVKNLAITQRVNRTAALYRLYARAGGEFGVEASVEGISPSTIAFLKTLGWTSANEGGTAHLTVEGAIIIEKGLVHVNDPADRCLATVTEAWTADKAMRDEAVGGGAGTRTPSEQQPGGQAGRGTF